MRVGAGAALVVAALALMTGPAAAAENPVLDAEGDADLVAALEEATEVQGVCYGYRLTVRDADTGRYSGTYAASSLGQGELPESSSQCPEGTAVLAAVIDYTSSFSDAEDSASWRLDSTLPALGIDDVEALGPSAGDLLDDGSSETALLNAVLSLPRLAAEQAGVPPVVLEPNTAPLPEGAQATGTPGSDWLRENGALLAGSVAVLIGGIALLVLSFRPERPHAVPRHGPHPGLPPARPRPNP